MDKRSIGAVSYSSVRFNVETTRFIETEGVPRDSRVVDHTWRYVNKRGGPDRRFKDNIKLPIAEYEAVHFQTDSGLNELINISKVGVFRNIEQEIQNLEKFLHSGKDSRSKKTENGLGFVVYSDGQFLPFLLVLVGVGLAYFWSLKTEFVQSDLSMACGFMREARRAGQ